MWADKYNRKLIIVRSAYVEGVIFGLAALSPNVWVLAVARLLGGFVLGNTGVMLALLADVAPRKRLGLAVGLASSGFPIGLSIGPYLGGVIVQNFDVRVLLGVDAVASALVGVALTLFVREEPRVVTTTRSVGRMLRDSLRSITGSAITLRLFALYFLAALASGLANPFVPILVRQLHLQQAGLPVILPTVIGVTLTGAGIASAIMTPIWGRLGDVIGRWTVLPICVGAVALALGVEAFAPSLRVFQSGLHWGGILPGSHRRDRAGAAGNHHARGPARHHPQLLADAVPVGAFLWANPRRRACLPRVAAAVWRWGVAGLYRLYAGGLARTGRTIRDTIRVSIRRPTRGGKERRFHASGLDRTTLGFGYARAPSRRFLRWPKRR